MIDTIILQIMLTYSAIIDPKRFSPAMEVWLVSQNVYRKYISNPTAEDKKKWGYLPKLKVIQRGSNMLVLQIEFSAQKMFNRADDNTNEIGDADFESVISRLRDTVEAMGVRLTIEQIEQADPLRFDPAKNIILSDCYDPTFVIGELKKVDISRKYDIDCKQYRNGGEVLQLFSVLHALCFYDKRRDERKPAKRAFDKDRSSRQSPIFGDPSLRKIEILRIEARLKKKKMEEIFEKIGYVNPSPTFKDIFSRDLSRKILQYYWKYFFEDDSFLFDARNSPQKILNMMLAKYKGKKIDLYKLFGMVGFILCAKDEDGMMATRNVVQFYKPKNNWSKTMSWLDDFKRDLDKSYLHGFIKDIETQLDDFKPFKMEIKG